MDYDDESDEEEGLLFLMTLIAGIMWYNSLRYRSYLTRSAVLRPRLSPWQHLYIHVILVVGHANATSFRWSHGEDCDIVE